MKTIEPGIFSIAGYGELVKLTDYHVAVGSHKAENERLKLLLTKIEVASKILLKDDTKGMCWLLDLCYEGLNE